MKRHGLTAGLLLAILSAAAFAQSHGMPNAYQGQCDDCRLLPGLRTLLTSYASPVQNCGCGVGCTQKCCQKSCCQKSVCQKGCCQKSVCQKSVCQKGGCVQKSCCTQKAPLQKSHVQKSYAPKGCAQKTPCQKSVAQKSVCQKSGGKGGVGGIGLGSGRLLTMLLGQRCCSDCCSSCGAVDAGYAPAPAGVIDEDVPQPRVDGSDPFADDPVMRPTSVAGRSVMTRR